MIIQERRVREKIGSQEFYTGSLKPELLSRQHEPDFALFQKIYKVFTLTLSK